jgi:hypothetical protein
MLPDLAAFFKTYSVDSAPRRFNERFENILSGRKSGAQMARLYDISEATVSRLVAQHRQTLS